MAHQWLNNTVKDPSSIHLYVVIIQLASSVDGEQDATAIVSVTEKYHNFQKSKRDILGGGRPKNKGRLNVMLIKLS